MTVKMPNLTLIETKMITVHASIPYSFHSPFVSSFPPFVCLYLFSSLQPLSHLSSHHCKQFLFMYSQKRFSQASLLISTKFFQNRIIMFCLELLHSVLHCRVQEIHTYFQIKTMKMALGTFYFLFYFYFLGIWDWGLANSFLDHAIQFSIRRMNFHYILPNYEKLKCFVETFTLFRPVLILVEQLCTIQVCPIWIFIFDTDQAQIKSASSFFLQPPFLKTSPPSRINLQSVNGKILNMISD